MGFNQGEAAEFNSGLAIIYQLDAIEKEMVVTTMEENHEKHYKLLLL